MSAAALTAGHRTTVTTCLGGHHWSCTCGERQETTASRGAAVADGLFHERINTTVERIYAGQGVAA
jgi:hypothetical protein